MPRPRYPARPRRIAAASRRRRAPAGPARGARRRAPPRGGRRAPRDRSRARGGAGCAAPNGAPRGGPGAHPTTPRPRPWTPPRPPAPRPPGSPPAGNKNAAPPILAATLLADAPCRIDNVPKIGDVETMLALLAHLGADVRWTGDHTVEIDPANAAPRELDPALCARIRASILLAGPMLARFGRVALPPPGGDVIGRRRVDTHLLALEQMGAEITVGDSYKFEAPARGLRPADIFLDEPSVTATENVLMAAAATPGTTVLRNAASEPHVQDLARFLTGLGAQVEGIGTNTLTVHGGKLRGAPGVVGPDHIEIGSFIGLAAATNGAITIDGVRAEDLRATLLAFDRWGVRPRLDGAQLVVDDNQERRIRADLGGHVPELEDGPWPQFPADLISIAIVVATQCEGLLLIFEKLFESRLFFVDKLDRKSVV